MKIRNIHNSRFSNIQEFLDLGIINDRVILAGGSLRSLVDPKEKVEDYDLFFIGAGLKEIKDKIEKQIEDLGGDKTYQCKKDELRCFILNGMKIQLISISGQIYNSIDELLNLFDINAGRFAWNGEFLYCNKQSVKDVLKKHITIHKVSFPIATIKRISKYFAKGYKVTLAAEEFIKQVIENHEEMDTEIVYID